MKARFFTSLLLLLGVCSPLLAQDGKTYTYHTKGSIAQTSRQSAEEVEDIGDDDEDAFLEEDEEDDENLDFDVGGGDER